MRRLLSILLLILIFSHPLLGANDLSDAVAHWTLESGAMGTDVSDGGNNLTVNNVTADGDVGDFKEDSYSGIFGSGTGSRMYLADASLDAGFPWSSGESATGSVCFWFKPNNSELPTNGETNGLFAKYAFTTPDTDKRTMLIAFKQVDAEAGHDRIVFTNGYDDDDPGGAGETYAHASDLSGSTWYHIGFSYNATNKAYKLTIHDESSQVGTDLDSTSAHDMSLTDSPLEIGGYDNGSSALFADGHIDDIIVWDRALTLDELDTVWAGTYAPPSGSSIIPILGPQLRRRR